MRRFTFKTKAAVLAYAAAEKPVNEDTLRTADEAFDVARMLEASRQDSRDDISESASVKSSISTISRPRKSSRGSLFTKREKRGSITLYSVADEYSRISQNWGAKCVSKGCPLPKGVGAEFSKRIKQAGSKGKSKLNFSNCGIIDEQVIMLMEELAVKAVVAKLDLSGNYISAVVR
jgi:hypothetical protein